MTEIDYREKNNNLRQDVRKIESEVKDLKGVLNILEHPLEVKKNIKKQHSYLPTILLLLGFTIIGGSLILYLDFSSANFVFKLLGSIFGVSAIANAIVFSKYDFESIHEYRKKSFNDIDEIINNNDREKIKEKINTLNKDASVINQEIISNYNKQREIELASRVEYVPENKKLVRKKEM